MQDLQKYNGVPIKSSYHHFYFDLIYRFNKETMPYEQT